MTNMNVVTNETQICLLPSFSFFTVYKVQNPFFSTWNLEVRLLSLRMTDDGCPALFEFMEGLRSAVAD